MASRITATTFGSRALLTLSAALVLLLGVLAVVQYRWSTRVAAADTQREKEHLDSAASLFAADFDRIVAEAVEFLQNDAWPALEANTPLHDVPKLIAQLYYVDPAHAAASVKRLNADGLFAPAELPPGIANRSCAALAAGKPSALVISIYDVTTHEDRNATGIQLIRTFSRRTERCFIGVIDESYLRSNLFPLLIRQSFGETTAQQYDFAVVSRSNPLEPIYGKPLRADVEKPFFSISPLPPLRAAGSVRNAEPREPEIFVQHVRTARFKGGAVIPDLFGAGIWQLDIAHKGQPLAAASERTRQRDLLFGLVVEALLVAGILFLMIGARRMQRLAEQKMQFVAGVSHELRTPLSAIAMLSRNQADGLVAGLDKVKQYGELIHQQSRRLNEMVEQALQYAGIHSELRRPAKREIDLRHLIQEAVDARREELARDGFAIDIALSPDLPPLVGDANLLWTAFDNLLSNALKYSGAGRWIRISAEYHAREKEVQVSVEDRGLGIDVADQAEIFEPFSRGKAAIEAQIPGSGLGLSLVRSAAEAHRGAVTLVSAPGRGSTFTLHLPV